MKIWGREPVTLLALFAALVQFVSAFVTPLSGTQQAVLNAVAVGVIGVITAFMVARERLLPAITGLAESVVALALAFGAELSAEQQSSVMAVVTYGVAMILRERVTAPVDEAGNEVRPVKLSQPTITRQSGGSFG